MNATTLPVTLNVARPKSALERHGIDHLSASSLNTWISCPSLWVMERLIGKCGPMGCSAHRGTAVEDGVSFGLFNRGATDVECIEVAFAKYDRLTSRSADPKRDSERAGIPGMVRQALDELLPLGPPEPVTDTHQHRIEIELDGVPVPLIGFLDFVFADAGLVVDLKTTFRVPSAMSASHRRQAAAYQHAASNAEIRFVYCSDKKRQPHTLMAGDYKAGLDELTHASRRLEKFLSLSTDPAELASIITPDYDAFYWSDPITRALGREVYGY